MACLLIATDKLDGAHIFERAVVLPLSTGPVGPAGVILNRPSLMSIKESKSHGARHGGHVLRAPALLRGGPSRRACS
ncbi:hypothetical protein NL676_014834 [Syzygium grande]|nr:hypothetical protein NL676_014834 [Syzygium grande]